MKTMRLIALCLGLSSAALAQDESPTEPATPAVDAWAQARTAPDAEPTPSVQSNRPTRECRRQLGISTGVVFPRDGWDLIGTQPVPTGSPALSLTCNLGGVIRPFAGLTFAPTQTHWYRELGRAGLFVMPSFGVMGGNGPLRFGVYTVMMPRLIGLGVSAELRFKGTEGNWLTHTSKGIGKGFELRFQVLDGDLVQYQMALLYTFGVNTP